MSFSPAQQPDYPLTHGIIVSILARPGLIAANPGPRAKVPHARTRVYVYQCARSSASKLTIPERSEEDSRHWQRDDKVTSLHAPNVVDCDRCVGEEKDQIHSHEVAQDTKSRYDRHARTDGPVQIQSLQRNDQKNDCEHEINPAWKPNILPPQDANKLRPQPVSPCSD